MRGARQLFSPNKSFENYKKYGRLFFDSFFINIVWHIRKKKSILSRLVIHSIGGYVHRIWLCTRVQSLIFLRDDSHFHHFQLIEWATVISINFKTFICCEFNIAEPYWSLGSWLIHVYIFSTAFFCSKQKLKQKFPLCSYSNQKYF